MKHKLITQSEEAQREAYFHSVRPEIREPEPHIAEEAEGRRRFCDKYQGSEFCVNWCSLYPCARQGVKV